jgi:transcription-repair coupling factor (superfamily II helicase)
VSERTKTRSIRAPRRVRAYLAANAERPALLLAASEEAAERYAREAEVFTEGPVVHLPSRGAPYGDVFDPAVSRVGRRQRALRSLRSARVVVAGPLAFMERTPLYEPMELDAGTEIELDATLERLVVLGYERVDRVSRPGEFAVRGGIVDIFPSTRRSPVRVEWWGDEIESVRAVSLATQRVVRELEAVTVYAAREGDLAGLAATDEDLPEEARRGVRVPGLDRLLLELNPISPRAMLSEDVEVWREEAREHVPEEVDGLVDELYDRGMPDPDVEFSLGDEGDSISAPPVAAFADTLREAARRLDSLVEDGLAVFVACSSRGEARRTVYAFGEIHRTMRETSRVDSQLPPGLYALPGEVEEGFTYPEGGVAVFRRDSLLGRSCTPCRVSGASRGSWPRRSSAPPATTCR